MIRGFLAPAGSTLLVVAPLIGSLALAGCGSGWTDEQQQKFVADCIRNVQLADMGKKQAICECWFDRTSTEYSYEVVKAPTREMGRVFIQWGKECSAAQGLAATIAPPQAAPGASGAGGAKAAGGKAPPGTALPPAAPAAKAAQP